MHIVYFDESGTHDSRYFVVAGISVFERETYFLARGLDQIQARYFPNAQDPLHFHASALRAPVDRLPEPFNSLNDRDRRQLLADVYELIGNSRTRLFGVAMEKVAIAGDPYARGFEEIVNRFDRMLGRIQRDSGEPQRGLIVVAESSFRQNLELLARKIATQGHRWGETYNLADIPYFAPSKSTRLLQLADFVSNAIYGRYESGYSRDFDQIAQRFDQDGPRIHGLVHIARDRRSCYCLACVARRATGPALDSSDHAD